MPQGLIRIVMPLTHVVMFTIALFPHGSSVILSLERFESVVFIRTAPKSFSFI